MIKTLIFAAAIAATSASCSNQCSGHGTCGEEDICSCFPRFTGPDCSFRECPYGPSWVAQLDSETQIGPATGALGGRHGYTVCSSKGQCNKDSGECECFQGYSGLACSRQECPEGCSGHGRCITNEQAQPNYKYANAFVSEYWDASMTRQCSCDRGWEGYACAQRICPVGADPLTCEKTTVNPTVQRITLDNMDFPFKTTDKFKVAISLGFVDMFGGSYTTHPIRLKGKSRGLTDTGTFAGTNYELRPCTGQTDMALCSEQGEWTTLNQYDAVSGEPFVHGQSNILEDYDANRIRYALQSLPNFAIPSVNVTDAYPLSSAYPVSDLRYNTKWYFDVTFTHAANAAAQNLMTCTIASPTTDSAAVSPRMGAPTIWEHTETMANCFEACNNDFTVDLLSDGTSACSTATTNEACDGNCEWTAIATHPDEGICGMYATNCLHNDGYGKYECDGPHQGVPIHLGTCGGGTSGGGLCDDSTLTIDTCDGDCIWDGVNDICIDDGAPVKLPDGLPVHYLSSAGTACNLAMSDTACEFTGSTCTWTAVTTCAGLSASEPAELKTNAPSGCPTDTDNLKQGNALAITIPSLWTVSQTDFERALERCDGGTSGGLKCADQNTESECDGSCIWNAADTTCGYASAEYETTLSADCSSATTELECDGECTWIKGTTLVQADLNVDSWWTSPADVAPLTGPGHLSSYGGRTHAEAGTGCGLASTAAECDGTCEWTGSACVTARLTTDVGILVDLLTACSTATTEGDCDGTCIWDVMEGVCLADDCQCANGDKAACDGGCVWLTGSTECVARYVHRRQQPTCTVEHVVVANIAVKHTCSNRGLCDEGTGICNCFEGYAGEDCSQQNIYF